MARIRLNNEYRNKIANRIKVHLQQEDTQEKRKYDSMKAEQVDINDMAWSVAEKIVRRLFFTAQRADFTTPGKYISWGSSAALSLTYYVPISFTM